MLPTDKQARKERPIARGVLGYFPDAIAEVAYVSFIGNRQHNPGQELHWARGKSDDHADCLARHLIEAGTVDTDGVRHTAKAAWRALAMLQLELEKAAQGQVLKQDVLEHHTFTPIPELKHAKYDPKSDNFTLFYPPERQHDFMRLLEMGCPDDVARLIVKGTTYCHEKGAPYVYIAGPMRGYEKFNFPAFDAARNQLVALGYNVVSPADIDRANDTNADDPSKVDVQDQTRFAFRDFWVLYFLRKLGPANGIVMLRSWEKSTGATAEYGVAKWLGLMLREIGDFRPCETSSSETSTPPSATPATVGSAATCGTSTNAKT